MSDNINIDAVRQLIYSDFAKQVADRHELMMSEAMEQFITQGHADIDTGLGYTVHLCFEVPCTHV